MERKLCVDERRGCGLEPPVGRDACVAGGCAVGRRDVDALARARGEPPARHQLVVSSLHGVFRDAELALQHTHRRQPKAVAQQTGVDLAADRLDDVGRADPPATATRLDVNADVG